MRIRKFIDWWHASPEDEKAAEGIVNPYASPGADQARVLSKMPPKEWENLDIRVAFVQRSSWRRGITLTGSLDAVVLYDSAGFGERVYVNERLAARTSGIELLENVTPHVEFVLECRGQLIPASIDVNRGFSFTLFRISIFRLTVAGKTVYDEQPHAVLVHK